MLSGNFQGWNKNWFVLTFFWAAKKKSCGQPLRLFVPFGWKILGCVLLCSFDMFTLRVDVCKCELDD